MNERYVNPLLAAWQERFGKYSKLRIFRKQRGRMRTLTQKSKDFLNAQHWKLEDKRQREVIERRFGIDGKPPWTLEETGLTFGVTRERIRQLEVKALRELGFPVLEYESEPVTPCAWCGEPSLPRRKYCGDDCMKKSTAMPMTRVMCMGCHVEFDKPTYQIRFQRSEAGKRSGYKGEQSFHNKSCHGKWFGKNHGVKFSNKEGNK